MENKENKIINEKEFEDKATVTVVFDVDTISKMTALINWENADNQLHKKNLKGEKVTIQNFIKGSVKKEIERLEIINEIFCELKTKPLRSPKKIKNNFKEILKLSGLKQQDLSDLTGISNSELSIVLNNKRFISMEYFLLIWTSLGCPPIEKCFYIENSNKN